MIDNMKDKKIVKTFDYKGAQSLVPDSWNGTNKPWAEFSEDVKNWMSALHERGVDLMEIAERPNFDDSDINHEEDYTALKARLYQMLVKCVQGEAKTFVKNIDRNGFVCWHKLAQHYDPKKGMDQMAMFNKILFPSPAKDVLEARFLLPKWEQDVAEYMLKFPGSENMLPEVAKITVLQRLVPPQLMGNAFVGKSYQQYDVYAKEVRNYLADRSAENLGTEKRSVERGSLHQLEESLNKMTEKEVKDMIASLVRPRMPQHGDDRGWKGKGKGWEKGSSEKGKGQEFGSGGKGPTPWSGDWILQKGKGKGKASTCWNCGKQGHFARDCFKRKSIWEVGEAEYGGQDGDNEVKVHDYAAEDSLCMLEDTKVEEKQDDHGREKVQCDQVFKAPELQYGDNHDVKKKMKLKTENRFAVLDQDPEDVEEMYEGTDGKAHELSMPVSLREKKGRTGAINVAVRTRWRTRCACKDDVCDLNCMEDEEVVIGNEIMAVHEKPRFGWIKVEAAVDSAAVDSVISEHMVPGARVKPSRRSREGRHYVAANNQVVENEGEIVEQFAIEDESKRWVHKCINFQIAKVGRPLLSVDKLIQAGNQVNLRKWGPHIITRSGDTIPLTRKNGIFIATLWMKAPQVTKEDEKPFSGQGR